MPVARYFCVLLLLFTASWVSADDASVDYATAVKPVLARHCAACHGVKKQQVGLRIDSAKGMLDGGDSGPAIVPGEAAKSLLIQAITGTEGASQMPPEGDKLSDAEIAAIRKWIDEGAKYPADEVTEAAEIRKSDHWAFQPIRSIVPPHHS
ncbi:MAG: c-type cytochrome domain-containing protein, partial [Schlesneria sp.]